MVINNSSLKKNFYLGLNNSIESVDFNEYLIKLNGRGDVTKTTIFEFKFLFRGMCVK